MIIVLCAYFEEKSRKIYRLATDTVFRNPHVMEIISDLRQFQIHGVLFSLRMAMFILFDSNGKFLSKIKTVKRKRNPKRYT